MQRKATKNTRSRNSAEAAFQLWLKQQPCLLGGRGITEVHHCKGSTFKHNKVLIGHWFCLNLSQEIHHEYDQGSKPWRAKYGNQADLWEKIHDRYFGETGDRAPDEVVKAIRSYGR
jgi:hypothetical protein